MANIVLSKSQKMLGLMIRSLKENYSDHYTNNKVVTFLVTKIAKVSELPKCVQHNAKFHQNLKYKNRISAKMFFYLDNMLPLI